MASDYCQAFVTGDKDEVDVVWGPYQIVHLPAPVRMRNTCLTGKIDLFDLHHGTSDNELPNFLYFNYIDIKTLQLTDVRGTVLSTIADGTFKVNKTGDYAKQYPSTVVDNPSERDWVGK